MRKTFSLPVAATAAGGGPTPPPADTVDNIEHSVRLNSADSAQLTKTFSSAGNTKINTISLWVKRNKISYALSTYQSFLSAGNNFIWHFDTSDRLGLYQGGFIRYTTQKFRDPSAWYHFVFATDTTQSAASDQIKVYVNGQLITDWDTETALTQNTTLTWNSNVLHNIGSNNNTQYPDIQIADVQNIDGLQLTPSSFGFTDSSGVWQPKAYSGSYGTNGFHLDFADTSSATALGNDVSGNNNDWTPSGLVAGPAYTANSFSTEFDGTGDYLSIPNSADLRLGSDDFTIEAWFNFDSFTGQPAIVGIWDNTNNQRSYLLYYYQGTLYFTTSTDGTTGGISTISSAQSLNTNQWYHVAVCRNSGATTLYLDGTSIATGTLSSAFYDNTTDNLGIGAFNVSHTPSGFVDGKISNLRVIKGRALYTAAFTPPTTALTATDDTVLLTCQDATVRDNSNIGHSVTANGDVAIVNEGPFNGYSGSFDGNGDYLSIPDNADMELGSDDFTIEFWEYHTNVNEVNTFITKRVANFAPIIFRSHSYGDQLELYVSDGSSWTNQSVANALNVDTWNHLAVVRSGTSIKAYVNGVETISLTFSGALMNNTDDWYIGSSSTYHYLDGKISNLRVVKGQALYTANFTPPTADLTTTSQGATASNVKLLTCQSKTFVDNSASAHTITANGDAHTVSVNPHTDKYSVTFDGTGDYLSTSGTGSFNASSGDWTIEGWCYFASSSGNDTLVTGRTSSSDKLYIQYIGSTFYLGDASVNNISFSNNKPLNQWFHLAATKEGSTYRVFINGILQGSSTTALANSVLDDWQIGARTSQTHYTTGKLSNVRVTDGQALYTSNFLPSKEDLTTTSQGATASNVKLLTCQSYKIQDNSASAHTITVNGDAAPSTVAPFVTSGAGSFDGTGDYLTTATHASDFNFGSSDFTMEFWVNSVQTGRADPIGWNYGYTNAGWAGMILNISPGSGSMAWYENASSRISGSGSWNDGSWHHIAVTRDGNSVRMFLDGTQIGSTYTTSHSYGAANSGLIFGAISGGSNELNGKISNVRISKGLARYTSNFTPPTEDFDPTDQDTTFLALQDNTLDDLSGNDHAVTANGDAATSTVSPFEPVDGSDAMLDSPTNYGSGDLVRGNYATWNPLRAGSDYSYSDGNLKATPSSGGVTYASCFSTMGVSSGKWYAEFTASGVTGNGLRIGICRSNFATNTSLGNGDSYSIGSSAGLKYNQGSSSSYAASFTGTNTIRVYLDLDNGTIRFIINDTDYGTAFSGLTGEWLFAITSYETEGGTVVANFGQQPFKYPLAGYKSLCSTNLPTPAVADGSTAMDVVTYTGTGTAQSISTPNLSPDLVWLKIRNTNGSHGLWDSVRGTSSRLVSNSTGAEDTTVGVTALSSNGFTVDGPYNTASNNWAAWTWDAGSSTVSNTDGTITSQVRANPTAGVSVVSYTGTGANATIGHGLNAAPEMIIVKNRDAAVNWNVYHVGTNASTPEQYFLRLNTTDAAISASVKWNNTSPTSSVFSVGTAGNTNGSGQDLIAYCFAPVEGFSSFGSYTGNGSTDGPFVYTGFKPKFLLVRSTSSPRQWGMFDTERLTFNGPQMPTLYANGSDAETTNAENYGDFLSNGFKARYTNGNWNGNGETYIYAAFAEHPFKTSRAR